MNRHPQHARAIGRVSDFTLPLVGGGEGSLCEQVSGKRGAVVVFWSSVCSHCIRYDGFLNQFETRYPDIALLAVAAREHETPDQIRVAMSQRGLQFPMLHDAARAVAHQWQVRQTPTAFLIDPSLKVIYRGAIDNFKYPQDADYRPYLEMAIDALLSGRSPNRHETPTFGCPIESVYYELPKPLGLH